MITLTELFDATKQYLLASDIAKADRQAIWPTVYRLGAMCCMAAAHDAAMSSPDSWGWPSIEDK